MGQILPYIEAIKTVTRLAPVVEDRQAPEQDLRHIVWLSAPGNGEGFPSAGCRLRSVAWVETHQAELLERWIEFQR